MGTNDAPEGRLLITPGSRLAGFIKRSSIHCYIQNIKALSLVVLEKIFFIGISLCQAMGANDLQGGAIFDHKGMIGRISVELHLSLLHSK